MPALSVASLAVRLSLADDFGWSKGRLVRGVGTDERICPVYGSAFGGLSPPGWVLDGLQSLDAALPGRSVLHASLSPRDLVLPIDPAVARIPTAPHVATAAACLFACRAALSLEDELVAPAFTDPAVEMARLRDAAMLVAAISGREAMAQAISMAGDPRTYARFEEDVSLGDMEFE